MSTTDFKTMHNPEQNPISRLRHELWNVMKNEITPFEASPALEESLATLINEGAGTVRVDPLTREMARALEAKQNLSILIKSMKSGVGREGSILDVPDLQASLRSLCPLFPFC